jgi:two-component system, OmpR family, response regulator
LLNLTPKSKIVAGTNRADLPIYPRAIFTITPEGGAQIRRGSTRLPADALSLLVMADGKKSVGDLEQALPQISSVSLRSTVRSLLVAGCLRELTMAEMGRFDLDFTNFFSAQPKEPLAGAKASAEREAAAGADELKQKGFYVSIARQALEPRKPIGGKRFSALIVEDDTDLSSLVKFLLRRKGFDVEIAANREQVLSRVRRTPLPDLMLVDVQLPDLNGFDLLSRLKLHDALKAIPVIMLTADTQRESVVQGLASGADGYVTKPFDKEIFVKAVSAVMGISF